MNRFVAIAMAIFAFAALALPGSASAARSTVPPGVSGANQYTESLPGAGGEESTKSITGGGGGSGEGGSGGGTTASPTQVLGTESTEKLEALGPEGKAAAALAAAGAQSAKGGAALSSRGEKAAKGGGGSSSGKPASTRSSAISPGRTTPAGWACCCRC